MTYSLRSPHASKRDSLKAVERAASDKYNVDTLMAHMTISDRQRMLNMASSAVQQRTSDLDFKSYLTDSGDRLIRLHKIYAIDKFLLAFICIVFFFIGAPLGAIIRKGGLGLPVLISVLVSFSTISSTTQDTEWREEQCGQ